MHSNPSRTAAADEFSWCTDVRALRRMLSHWTATFAAIAHALCSYMRHVAAFCQWLPWLVCTLPAWMLLGTLKLVRPPLVCVRSCLQQRLYRRGTVITIWQVARHAHSNGQQGTAGKGSANDDLCPSWTIDKAPDARRASRQHCSPLLVVRRFWALLCGYIIRTRGEHTVRNVDYTSVVIDIGDGQSDRLPYPPTPPPSPPDRVWVALKYAWVASKLYRTHHKVPAILHNQKVVTALFTTNVPGEFEKVPLDEGNVLRLLNCGWEYASLQRQVSALIEAWDRSIAKSAKEKAAFNDIMAELSKPMPQHPKLPLLFLSARVESANVNNVSELANSVFVNWPMDWRRGRLVDRVQLSKRLSHRLLLVTVEGADGEAVTMPLAELRLRFGAEATEGIQEHVCGYLRTLHRVSRQQRRSGVQQSRAAAFRRELDGAIASLQEADRAHADAVEAALEDDEVAGSAAQRELAERTLNLIYDLTGHAFSGDGDDADVSELIASHVHVWPDEKASLASKVKEEMPVCRQLLACGSCGLRDPTHKSYREVFVDDHLEALASPAEVVSMYQRMQASLRDRPLYVCPDGGVPR